MSTECQFFRAADGSALLCEESECQGIRAFCPHHPTDTEIPRWRSHKIVQAAKITGARFDADMPALMLAGGFRVEVSHEMWSRIIGMTNSKEWPDLVGGYYVRYPDGFESWSPAKAFEEGYTRHE